MNTLTLIQTAILEDMFKEVRETFDSIIGNFYREQGINIDDVDITNDDYMRELVDIALEEYINNNDYESEFENMKLWDNTIVVAEKTKAFGLAIWYITTTSPDDIPVEYFREFNYNKIRVLFKHVYFCNNKDVVKQTLIDVYRTETEDDTEETEDDAEETEDDTEETEEISKN